MHEASLVANLLRQVEELVRSRGGTRAAAICVEAGPLSGIEPLLFREAFGRLRVGTIADGAELTIEAVELQLRCRACRAEYATERLRFQCPACDSGDVDVTGGDGVALKSITIVVNEEATAT